MVRNQEKSKMVTHRNTQSLSLTMSNCPCPFTHQSLQRRIEHGSVLYKISFLEIMSSDFAEMLDLRLFKHPLWRKIVQNLQFRWYRKPRTMRNQRKSEDFFFFAKTNDFIQNNGTRKYALKILSNVTIVLTSFSIQCQCFVFNPMPTGNKANAW